MKRLLLCIVCCCYTLLLLAATTNRNAIAAFKLSNISERQTTEIAYTTTSEFPLDNVSAISGLSISGRSQLNSNTSLVRVLLIDNTNKSYLVYEDFYLTASDLDFQDMAFETAFLDSVIPSKLKIIIRDATLYLTDISYHRENSPLTRSFGTDRSILAKAQQQSQEEYMIDRWNEYNDANNQYWFAGKTPLSGLSYEAKKSALGAISDAYLSDGLEYYVGGFFVMRDIKPLDSLEITPFPSYSNYVESFDWRNRHGRNWMTSVKNQKDPDNATSGNGGCWAFAACATVEAKMNIQFNQLLDYDLSEQELGSCTNGSLLYGGDYDDAFPYIETNGIVTEECMKFKNDEFIPCENKCRNPIDVITTDHHDTIWNNADTLKHYLINNGPFYSVVKSGWMHHAMCLCGYGTIHAGDSVRYLVQDSAPQMKRIIEGDTLIGRTYWIYKNSYGLNHKYSFNGYYCLIFDDVNMQKKHCIVEGLIHSTVYNHEDVICEDRDGDGYYFWGLGEKPAHCPSCAPDEPDGDDSNPNLTVMNEYGQFLPAIMLTDIVISTNAQWNENDTLCGDVYIQNNATLTITNASITLHPLSHILIEAGGTLIVDNATILNADIVVNPGGSLVVLNEGILQQGENDNIDVKLGGLMQFETGEIRKFE